MTDNLVTPVLSPLPSPSIGPLALSDQINAFTRATHLQLNRLLLSRLPLALPPNVASPDIYLSGMLHIAAVYVTFESLWQSILDAPNILETAGESESIEYRDIYFPPTNPEPIRPTEAESLESNVSQRRLSALHKMRLPGLARSNRLLADIRSLSGLSEDEVRKQVAAVSKSGELAEFTDHIKQAVGRNPHVLLAYSWVLYMALFSGGRYIRASLHAAGPAFWTRSTVEEQLDTAESPAPRHPPYKSTKLDIDSFNTPGLSFFNFRGDQDGEDIKIEFKKRFGQTESILNHQERQDIVQEAQMIFSYMISLVNDLDSMSREVAEQEKLGAGSSGTSKSRILTSQQNAHEDLEENEQHGAVAHVATIVTKLVPSTASFGSRVTGTQLNTINKVIHNMTSPLSSRPTALVPIFGVVVALSAWYYVRLRLGSGEPNTLA